MATNRLHALVPANGAQINNRLQNQLLRGTASMRGRMMPHGGDSTSWRALRVLIVDEELEWESRLVGQVRHWGHATRMAYDVRAALIAVADQRPHVVLINLELPFMNGRCLARQLSLHSPQRDFFIIAFANWADDERRRQCSEAGIDLLLVNPTDPSVLEVLLWLECVRLNRATDRRS